MFQGVDQLEDKLTEPSPADVECVRRIKGDIILLGAGGKMGPTLAKLARRACGQAGVSTRVIAVSRFSSPEARADLERAGIEVIACDLLDRSQVARLPRCENVLYLSGRKFGSSDRPDLTWAINAVLPSIVAEHYRDSRIVAFSTGNIYPFTPVGSGGSVETDSLNPVGEYAQSCLGRERVFEYYSQENKTRCLLFRLNYAVDLRYGVLVDIARKVFDGRPVGLGIGSFNVVWQGDANSYALRSLELCASPPCILNVTGPETVSVRRAAEFFAARFGSTCLFDGEEGPAALLSNASKCHELLGYPRVSLGTLMNWVADWVAGGGVLLNKPTKFEVADGSF